MFVKKDLRKIPKIIEDGQEAIDTNREDKFLKDLKLGRRQNEFQGGSVRILCQPKSAPALKHLETLSLYDCQITNLNGIGMLECCPNLATLNLGHNTALESLPDELSKLSSLKELLVDDCGLIGPFPKCVLELDKLEVIRMSNNKITTLPTEICLLSKLRVLAMDRNLLKTIPEELQDLTELKTLLLRHNQIESLPAGVPGSTMINLTLVHISSNEITKLPDSLVECTSITHLYANNNNLKTVPFGMEGMTNLQRLNLGHNDIDYLPTDFCYSFGKPDPKDPHGLCIGGKHPLEAKVSVVGNPVTKQEKSPPKKKRNIVEEEEDKDNDAMETEASSNADPSSSTMLTSTNTPTTPTMIVEAIDA